MIYKVLFESIYTYDIIIWGSAYKHIIKPLDVFIKRIIKLISGKPKLYPTLLLYNEFKVRSLKQNYYIILLNYSIKIKNNLINFASYNRSVRD